MNELIQIFQRDPGIMIAFLAIGGGLSVVVISIVLGSVAGMAKTKAREHSRREIAAYIAEGAMTPEEGQALLVAGDKPGGKCC